MNIESMKEKTLDLTKVYLIGFPFSVILGAGISALYFLYRENPLEAVDNIRLPLLLILLLVCTVVHELIHGLFFGLYAKGGFKTVKFGVMWKSLAPYCHCNEPINVHQYRVSVLMPTILLGFLPVILGFVLGEVNTTAIGAFMTIGGIGDFIVLWMLRGFKKDTVVLDHPSKVGFLYDDNDNV